MKTVKLILVITLLSIFSYSNCVTAQCSDSGICVIPVDNNVSTTGKFNRNIIGFDYSLALSGNPEKITYNLFRLNSILFFSSDYSVFISVPLQFETSSKSSTTNGGLGDAILMLNKSIVMGNHNTLDFQIGTKLPSSLISKKNFLFYNGYGTFDIMAGVNYSISDFSLGVFAQLPITSFKEDLYTFERGADVMLRGSYKFNFDDWAIKLECLAIKRLKKSTLTAKTVTPEVALLIPDSDFFQLNGIAGVEYKINSDFIFNINAALPFLERKENSDGTKRAFTIQTGLKYFFN